MLSFDQTRELLASGSHIRELIWRNLYETPISLGQLDPNGLCNAKCWFCPVKHEGNPIAGVNQLDPSQLDEALANIRASKVAGGSLSFLYTAHYNEVLLYKHFDKLLESFRKHRFRTMVLSNGTTITPANVDLLNVSKDIVDHVALNVPGIDKEGWTRRAGFNESVHKVLLRNLDYLHDSSELRTTVLINVMTEFWAGDVLKHGIITSKRQAALMADEVRARYPRFQVEVVDALVDRAGWLADAGVIENQRAIITPKQTVVACDHDAPNGSRLYGWLHVNAHGDLFVCCDDYAMKYKFGNILHAPLDEIWLAGSHIDAIEQAFNELCRRCCHHVLS